MPGMPETNTGEEVMKENSIFEELFNSLPVMALLVDEDVRIQKYNSMASVLFGKKPEVALSNRAGDVLHCVNAMSAENGCGTADLCQKCIIRNSVNEAFRGGKVFRKTTVFKFLSQNAVQVLNIVVTAVPFSVNENKLVLLMLEDISEILQLRSLIPICANCKKIQSDEVIWQHVEEYFNTHTGSDFTHTICPECMKKLYPELPDIKKIDKNI
jgi:hypothetical protein